MSEQTTKKNKLLSAKLWITLWAMFLTTFIVLANKVDFYNIAWTLCSVPLAYIGANVFQKNIYSREEIEKAKIENEGAKESE